MDYVYGVRFGRYTKIGHSTDPGMRKWALRSKDLLHPEDLQAEDREHLFAVPGNRLTERVLHGLLADQRAVGEWFTLGDGAVEDLRTLNAMFRAPFGPARQGTPPLPAGSVPIPGVHF